MKRDIDELNLDSPSIGPISIMSGRGVLSAYDVTSKGKITAKKIQLSELESHDGGHTRRRIVFSPAELQTILKSLTSKIHT